MIRKTLVIGLGISGRAASSFLVSIGRKVLGVDKRFEALQKEPFFVDLLQKGLELNSDTCEVNWTDFEQVILSPGVDPQHSLVQGALKNGIEVIGEAEMAFRELSNKVLAITGSNGKTTVTLLTTFILNCTGKKAKALGNVGNSLAEYLLKKNDEEILVVELSSFQLETLKSSKVDAGAILNISPNHLDRYDSFELYGAAKCNLQKCLKKGKKLFVSKSVGKDFAKYLMMNKLKFFEDVWQGISEGSELWNLINEQKSAVEKENILAAYSLCSTQGVSPLEFATFYPKFQRPEHRIEFVAEIKGICFYNDSKATSVHPVIHAVNMMKGPTFLIVGGKDKGLSYEAWNEAFQGRVKKVFAIGECARKIASALSALNVEIIDSFEGAVRQAYQSASKGECVLLSPGCSSYDMFKNFEERGDKFKNLVRSIEKEEEGK